MLLGRLGLGQVGRREFHSRFRLAPSVRRARLARSDLLLLICAEAAGSRSAGASLVGGAGRVRRGRPALSRCSIRGGSGSATWWFMGCSGTRCGPSIY